MWLTGISSPLKTWETYYSYEARKINVSYQKALYQWLYIFLYEAKRWNSLECSQAPWMCCYHRNAAIPFIYKTTVWAVVLEIIIGHLQLWKSGCSLFA